MSHLESLSTKKKKMFQIHVIRRVDITGVLSSVQVKGGDHVSISLLNALNGLFKSFGNTDNKSVSVVHS